MFRSVASKWPSFNAAILSTFFNAGVLKTVPVVKSSSTFKQAAIGSIPVELFKVL
jgi:hypothetical protein